MPCNKNLSIDTSKPVLVTGATGYVAGVLISQLVEKGATVHATVRDPSNKSRLKYLQDLADKSKGSIKFFQANLVEPGSFEEGMKGCSVVFHTASPFVMNVKDPQKDLVDPAVRGTENVLNACSKTPSVKRVVLTSSCAAIYSSAADLAATPNGIFTEEVWNRTSSLTDNPYSYSKTLAEQKAWVMAGGQTQWTLVVINPALVMGPGVKYHDSSESFGILKMLAGGEMALGAPHIPMGIVDIREVAAAHIAAAYLPQAGGRHILVGTDSNFPQMAAALREKYPEYPIASRTLPIPKWLLWLVAPYVSSDGGMTRSFVWNNINLDLHFDNSKSKEQLGIEYRSLQETMQDMFAQMIEVGAIPKPQEK